MKPTKHAVLGLFVTSVLLSGCTAPAKTAGATKEKPRAVQSESQPDNSAQYSATGSWIPRKVKKKEDVIGTNTQYASKEAMEKAQLEGSSHMTKEPAPPPGR